MASNGGRFVIRLLKSEDVEEVARLLSKVFSEREPVTVFKKIDENTFYSNVGKLWTEDCLKEDLSFVCLDTTVGTGNQIVGFRLSETLRKPVTESKPDDSAASALQSLLRELKNEWFEKHPRFASEEVDASKCLYFVALGVKDGYESFGIASKLVEYSINHAKLNGYEYVFVVATNSATQHIFKKKYNFSEVTAKNFSDIEFKGVHFLKGITDPQKLISYELDLRNWDIILHPVSKTF